MPTIWFMVDSTLPHAEIGLETTDDDDDDDDDDKAPFPRIASASPKLIPSKPSLLPKAPAILPDSAEALNRFPNRDFAPGPDVKIRSFEQGAPRRIETGRRAEGVIGRDKDRENILGFWKELQRGDEEEEEGD